MALPLAKKKEQVEEILQKLNNSDLCMLADPIGLSVAEVSDLRRKLLEQNVDYKIYKNTLIKRAIEEKGEEGLKNLYDHLKGPTGVATTQGDPIVAAKVFADFAKENDKLTLKAAVFQGDYWNEVKVVEMSKLGSMASIYGQLVAALRAPMFKLVNTLTGPTTQLVLTLKAVAEKEG